MTIRICVAIAGLTLLSAGCISNRYTRAADRAAAAKTNGGKAAEQTPKEKAARLEADDDASTEPVSAMTVNGRTVSIDDVIKPIRKDLERRAASMTPDAYAEYAVGAIQSRVRGLAREALLFEEAKKNITEEEEKVINGVVDEELRKKVNTEYSGRQTRLEKALAEEGLTMADEREAIHRRIVIVRWLQLNVTPKLADPTRDELWRIYEAQRDTLVKPPRRDMLIIEIGIGPDVPAAKNAASSPPPAAAFADGEATTPADSNKAGARRAAEAARQELLDGADFAAMAAKYSTGWHKTNGGRWGWVTPDGVRPHLQPAVNALFDLPRAGVPSEVIEAADAFYIVEAAAIDPGHQPDFAELQPELLERRRDAQFNKIIDEHVARLQKSAQIRPKNIQRFLQSVALAAPQPSATGAAR